ncbi:helix-turn-helix transcriptional regulator [Angustibacter peucedani]
MTQDVQTLLLVAAADDTGSLAVVEQAAAVLGVGDGAVQQAEQAQLLETDRDQLRVRHPLVRSAMYQAATGHERRRAHRALAAALATRDAGASTASPASTDAAGSGDSRDSADSGLADRRTWHLAAAAEGPDPDVAAALERIGARAERAGAAAAAAAAYERAAELTTDQQEQGRRTFAAARSAWGAGQSARAALLADRAKALADDRLLRADIDRLRARIEVNVGSAATAHHIFISAARAVSTDDPVRALEMRVAATLTHQYNAAVPHDIDDIDEVRSSDQAPAGTEHPARWQSDQALPDDPRTRCLRDLLAATAADTAHHWADALPLLSRAVEATAAVEDPDVLANVGNAALHLGDDEGHRRCFTRMLAGARDRGAVMSVLYALPRLAYADLLSGDWDRVRDAAEEAISLAGAAGQRSLTATPLAWLTLLAAVRGEERYEDLRTALDEAQRQPLGVLTDPVRDMSRWAAGVHAANAGDSAQALHHFSQMRVTTIARMAALDRFDAAVRCDEGRLAKQWVEDLAEFADATGWPWALAAVAGGRALLADPAHAPGLFATALLHHENAARPYELARTHLAYGEVLRRSQRRVDSRTHLRAAAVLLDELGAAPLADRAAQELRASGATARKRDPSTLTALTPMELQVVGLVAQGMSNKDVGAQLWISPRTVAFHLRGAFAKLGVSSRGALSQLDLPNPDGTASRPSRASGEASVDVRGAASCD